MSIYIFEEDALDKMAELEGQPWKEQQEKELDSKCGFHFFLDIWEKEYRGNYDLIAEGVKFGCFVSTHGDGNAIYGRSGFNRYAVRVDGKLFFLRDLAINNDVVETAMSIGFDII